MRFRRCGAAALLVEVEDVLGWYAALVDRSIPGVMEVIPAARTVLVRFEQSTVDGSTLESALAKVTPVPVAGEDTEPVTIEVCYDGEDLAEVARETGLRETQVVEVHTGSNYVVGFSGFAPGFGYLTGLDERLRLPRRDTPRVRVPAGAVAIAGEFTGVYPRPSPGGWRLLGHTNATLWDPARENPALLRPGTRVRFAPVDTLPPTPEPEEVHSGQVTGGVAVRATGPLATVQDRGRPGYASLGVGPSGVADQKSAALANRLVGNAVEAACLEVTFGGLELEFREPARLAITGAPCPITRDGRGEAMNAPFAVTAGSRLTLSTPTVGVRTYVAIRGGIDAPETLGSRSTDLLSGLGPAPLQAGDMFPIGRSVTGPPPTVQVAPVAVPSGGDLTVRLTPGPRDDWFTAEAWQALLTGDYVVTAESNRIGVRLRGPELTRSRSAELPSEAVVAGAVQVPISGQPLVFLADHPVTGGYPVIAVVCAADLPMVAQARPGQVLRFRG